MGCPSTCGGKGLLTHFLMKHLERSGNQKKKTRFAGLFFLTGLWPVLPLGQCPPKSAPKDFAPAPKTLKCGRYIHYISEQQLLVTPNTHHTTTCTKHSEMQPRHVKCLHRIRMTYPLEIRKYNRSESSDKNHRKVEKKSWKSVNGKPFPAIATCFWKIERAVWSSGNITIYSTDFFQFQSCDS